MDAGPTKTFGMRGPSDLHRKLVFDINRLEKARWSDDVRFAAFDCAVSSWHLVDWVLNSVDEDCRRALCGKKPGEKYSTWSFAEHQKASLPHLIWCQQIANSGKHLILSMIPDDPALSAQSTVRFHPPFQADRPETWGESEARAVAVIKHDGMTMDANIFFRDVAQQWGTFLIREGLYEEPFPEPTNVFS